MAAEPTPNATPNEPLPTLKIHTATTTHLASTAALHGQQLPNGLFPALGAPFLRTWHTTFLDSAHAAAAVMVDTSADDTVAGYLLLATDPLDHVHELKVKHRRELLRTGMLGLARRPRIGLYFARTRATRYTKRLLTRRPHHQDHQTETPPAVVHAVVTSPRYVRQGVARRLLEWAEEHAAEAGAAQLALVTDTETAPASPDAVLAPDELQGAAAMYDHLGWRRVAVRERDGRTLMEYRKDLPTGVTPND